MLVLRPDFSGIMPGMLAANMGIAGLLFVAAGICAIGPAWAGAVAMGRGGRTHRYAPTTESFAGRGIGFDLAAGILLSSLFVLGAGLTGLLYPGIVALAVVACLPGGLAYAWGAWRAADGISLRRAWPALFLLPALPWIIASPLLPPTDVDILTYHAGLPELWRLQHGIFASPGNVFFNLPLGLERMPFYFMPFGIPRAAPGFHLIALAVAAVSFAKALAPGSSLAGVGCERSSPNAGLAGAGGWMLFGCGSALYLAAGGHPDTGLLLAAALGTLAIVRGSVVGLGLACALAVSDKYTGAVLAAALLAACAWKGRGMRFAVRGPAVAGAKAVDGFGVRQASLAATICLVLNLPWMLKNLFETGNPVYPFGAGIFPSLNWQKWNSEALWAVMRDASVTMDRYFPEDLAVQLPTIVWRGIKTVWVSPYACLLIVMPTVLLGRAFSAPARRLALVSLLFALVWLVPEPKVGRYLLPGLVPALGAFLMAASPASLATAAGSGTAAAWFRRSLLAFVLLGGLSFVSRMESVPAAPFRVLTGALGAREYARARIGSYEDVRDWLNARPGGGRILVIGQSDGHGLSRPWVSNDDTSPPAWFLVAGADARDPGRVRARFRQAGVRMVLYNPIRACHRRGLQSGLKLPDAWYSVWAEFWRRHARLVRAPESFDWTGGWYVYEIGEAGSPPSLRPWLPGAEALLSEDAELIRGHADLAAEARRDRLIGDFGISWYQRMLAGLGTMRNRGDLRSPWLRNASFAGDRRDVTAVIRAGREAEGRGLATPWLFDALAKACRAKGLTVEAGIYGRRVKVLTAGEAVR